MTHNSTTITFIFMPKDKPTRFGIIATVLFCIGFFVFWYGSFLLYRPKKALPINNKFPPPPASISTLIPASSYSPPPDAPPDTRSWGERLRDPVIPDVKDITWQVYMNKEYGFEVKYPDGWEIQKSNVPTSGGVMFEFFNTKLPFGNITKSVFNVYKGHLKNELIRGGTHSWNERIQRYGLVSDATINNINMYIESPQLSSNNGVLLSVFFEKNGFIFSIGETFDATNNQDHKITEYIIKSFHFLK